MPSLEERLFHCIERNLKQKEEVLELYARLFDGMREASLKRDFSQDVVSALNAYKGKDVLKQEDIGQYEPLHVENNSINFEKKHGIKSFLFGIKVGDEKWKHIKKKMGWQKWAEGFFIPAGHFTSVLNYELMFCTFGLVIGNSHALYEHEALHACRQIYSANCYFIDGYGSSLMNPGNELKARCEYTFVDEMHCYLNDNRSFNETARLLKGDYWDSEKEAIFSIIVGSGLEKIKKKGLVKKAIKPVWREIECTIRASHVLKNRLAPEVLTPLFYSLGPTIDEIRNKNFPSIFADIRLWAELLERDVVRQGMIRAELQKKGYCCDDIIMA